MDVLQVNWRLNGDYAIYTIMVMHLTQTGFEKSHIRKKKMLIIYFTGHFVSSNDMMTNI